MLRLMADWIYEKRHPDEAAEARGYADRLARYGIRVRILGEGDPEHWQLREPFEFFIDLRSPVRSRRRQMDFIRRAAELASRRAERWANSAHWLRIPRDDLYDRTERRAVWDELFDHGYLAKTLSRGEA